MSAAEFARIFGKRDPSHELEVGRNRLCRTCGGYHSLSRPWPGNCLPPAPARNRNLATPAFGMTFDAFVTDTGQVINDRREKRDFMERHDLVEFDAGVSNQESPFAEYEWKREFAQDVKRALELDPLERKPREFIGETDLAQANEIDVQDLEVFGNE